MSDSDRFTLRTAESVAEFDPAQWDALDRWRQSVRLRTLS